MEQKILVKKSLYPIEAVLRSAYAFTDKAYVFLDEDAKNVIVRMRKKEDCSEKDFAKITGEFENELLNYAVRVSLGKTTKKLRERIIEKALYSAVIED